jgi:hypothetical protein
VTVTHDAHYLVEKQKATCHETRPPFYPIRLYVIQPCLTPVDLLTPSVAGFQVKRAVLFLRFILL